MMANISYLKKSGLKDILLEQKAKIYQYINNMIITKLYNSKIIA